MRQIERFKLDSISVPMQAIYQFNGFILVLGHLGQPDIFQCVPSLTDLDHLCKELVDNLTRSLFLDPLRAP